MAIYSGFTHWKWLFSIVMLVYQRVNDSSERGPSSSLIHPKLGTRCVFRSPAAGERGEESPNVQGLEQRLKNLLLKHGEAVKTPCDRGFMLIPKWFCWTMHPCTSLRCVFPVEPPQVDLRFIHNKASILRVCLIFRTRPIWYGSNMGSKCTQKNCETQPSMFIHQEFI